MAKALHNIILTGFMGTGKSAVGRIVASSIGADFVDTDELIAAEHGPIADIFAARGETDFRDIERAMVASLLDGSPRVIATGGGTLLDGETAQVIAATGPVYTLTASPSEILRRVAADGLDHRPLFADHDPASRIAELLSERAPVYDQFTQVRTEGRDPQAIAAEIVNDAANRGAVELDPDYQRRRVTLSPTVLIVVLGLLIVGLLLAGLYLFASVSSDDGALADIAANPQDLPANAPAADEHLQVVPIFETGPRVEREVSRFTSIDPEPSTAVVPGSALHVAAVASPLGQVNLYEWDEIPLNADQPSVPVTCVGHFGEGSGGADCGNGDGPAVGWGSSSSNGSAFNYISVSSTPVEAVWMVVETDSGWRVVSDVVGNHAYSKWEGVFGERTLATLYDHNLDEVWSDSLG